jgi:hypothetical protein
LKFEANTLALKGSLIPYIINKILGAGKKIQMNQTSPSCAGRWGERPSNSE